MKQSLKMKLEMAKFLQDTMDEMAVQHKGDKRSQTAREFSQFFEKVPKELAGNFFGSCSISFNFLPTHSFVFC